MAELLPSQIEGKLRDLVHVGEQLAKDYAEQAVEAAVAEAEYRKAYARAFLTAPYDRVADKEPYAMDQCGKDGTMDRRKISAAVADGTKQAIYTNRDAISAVQTISANLRAEFGQADRLAGGM